MGCKANEEELIKKLTSLFYLNYVGCKVIPTTDSTSNIEGFYLNYVGCKVTFAILETSPTFSFTLTMWDVKDGKIIYRTRIEKFYLNYVGCKAQIESSSQRSCLSFTLTMWDVKTEVSCSKTPATTVLP